MSPPTIVKTLVGLVGALAVTTLVAGRASQRPHPALALSTVTDRTAGDEAAARHHVIIEPLPVPTVAVALENVNSQERATFHIGAQGEMDRDEAVAIEHFLRCRRTDRELAMSPGVLAMLADVAKHWPGRTIEIISGYRAAPFGAPHSKHFRGHAIDLRVHGVRTAALRDYVWRGHHEVGVGHYPETNFVHMDWRPGEPDMAWTGADEEGTPEYNPRWAWRARHLHPPHHGHARASVAVAATPAGTL
jgi:uncharacterized protein YcbK (DUF882 family)